MTGAVMKPAGNSGPPDMSNPRTLSPSYVNSFRISAVTSRLFVHLRGDANTDNTEFYNLCLSLARGIDYAVANNEIPSRAPDLPHLFKQVCQRKNDQQLQAAVMVLMISVKSACSNGWFSEKEKEELYALSDEMQSRFCSVSIKDMHSNMKNTESNIHHAVSAVMSRFYPGMKMGEILCLLEAMPGYDSYVTDLHISKSSRSSPDHKIYLFVTQTDNMETSSCIISPQHVSFLLNGEGVDRRTCVYKDPGPQMPTSVTHMLKYGSNLLQVLGQFNAKYIIAIAFMDVVATPSHLAIQDYIPPAAAADSDNEIVEGPSRISLKCPISFGRIKIPVKGLSCKHLQCFDFNNYVGINMTRPLWRCPHCSQSVCFLEIRIDQSMVKVLKEVGEDVFYVKFSSDGSWEAVTEINEHTEKPHDLPLLHQERPIQNVNDIMDLTEGDSEVDTRDKDDKKPSLDEFHGKTMVINSTPNSTSMNDANTTIAPHMEDGFWREFYSSSLPPRMTNARVDVGDRQQDVFGSHLPQNRSSQNQGRLDYSLLSSQTSPQLGSHSASPQQTSTARHTPPLPADGFDSHRSLSKLAPILESSTLPSHIQNSGMGPTTSGYPYSLANIQRATNTINWSPSIPLPIPTSSPSIPLTSTGERTGNSVDASAEQNWRPAGRMRGSLSGRAYNEALNHLIIHPNQPVQAARPPPVLNAPRPFIPPHLQALMANNSRAQSPQAEGGGPDSNDGDAVLGDK